MEKRYVLSDAYWTPISDGVAYRVIFTDLDLDIEWTLSRYFDFHFGNWSTLVSSNRNNIASIIPFLYQRLYLMDVALIEELEFMEFLTDAYVEYSDNAPRFFSWGRK